MILEDYFEWFSQDDNAVYWESADRQTTLMGFGIADTCDAIDLDALKHWQAKQEVPVFGGFAFDEQIPANQRDLLAGFIAPKVVIDCQTETFYGDVRYLARTLQITLKELTQRQIVSEQTETDWINRVDDVINIMKEDATKEKTVLGAQKELTFDGPLDEAQLLIDLNHQQKTSYHVAFKRNGTLFLSATPERLVSVKDGQFSTAAVAGSTPRGETPALDATLGEDLLADVKNRHEHALVVSEIVKRVTPMADVTWSNEPILLQTPQIQHLYTPITGHLHANKHLLDVVKVLHPTPALGGVPQQWAMQTIATVEDKARGLFAAPIGMIWPNGDGEFVIGIRAMVLANQTATLFAGAGILAASNAQQEWAEINLKMTPMLSVMKEQINGK
jgi:menaquinone-specific isochorismate synthase